MNNKRPNIAIDILIIRDDKILMSKLTKKWATNGIQTYGIPGREIRFKEKIGEAVQRNIIDEIGCNVTKYEVIAVNANYELDNHFISIGVLAEIEGEIKLLKPEDWEKWEWVDIDKIPTNIFVSAKYTIESYISKKVCVSE